MIPGATGSRAIRVVLTVAVTAALVVGQLPATHLAQLAPPTAAAATVGVLGVNEEATVPGATASGRVTVSPTVLATVQVGAQPSGVGIDATTNRIYVANSNAASLSVIDGATNTVLTTIPLGNPSSNNEGVAVNPGTQRVYVTRFAANSVTVINSATNALVTTIPVGTSPGGIAVNTVTNRVYVANLQGFLSGVTGIAASRGGGHSLALKSDGTVFGWGRNASGQLGSGTSGVPIATPVGVSGLTGAITIAAGETHSLAVVTPTTQGSVVAWGGNASGQIGDGGTTDRLTPVPVSLGGVTAISAGRSHSIALKFDGTVWAWGSNTLGQLGDGTTTQRNMPVQVSSLTSVVAIATGGFHSVALKSDGTVWAWGRNDFGSLGDGTTTNRLTPVQVKDATGVASFTGATKIAAGELHTLALKSDGTLWAWGLNNTGQLGDGTILQRTTPVQVKDATGAAFIGATAIAGGLQHSLAVRAGAVWAWGQNSFGELGNGTTISTNTPVQVQLGVGVAFTGAAAVAAGTHSLALKSDGTVWAWGRNDEGQLGDGTTTQSLRPVQVVGAGGAGPSVSVIDGAMNTVVATITGGFFAPQDVAVNPVTNVVYLADSTTVKVIDGSTNSVLTSVFAGGGSRGIAVNPSTNKIYVANATDNNVAVIDGQTNTVSLTKIPVGAQPFWLGLNPSTNHVYVPNAGGNTVTVIDAATNTVDATVVVGSGPVTARANPTTDRVYVANFSSNTVSVIGSPSCAAPPSGLVGWWPGDGNTNDIGGGDTATTFGGVTFGAGQVAQGFTLNGIDGYVRIPDTAALKPAALTVDFWFKPDVQLDVNVLEAPLLVKLNETDDVQFVSKGYDFLYEFGALRFGLVSTSAGARNNVDFAVTIPAGTWHHVAGTYDTTGQKLYFDGQLVATGVNFGPIAYPAGTTNIQLGRDLNTARGPSPFFFKGTIDEVQVASRAFTASEIQAIYSALGAGVCKAVADLAVAVSASPDPAAAGALLSYTISVTNNGPTAATGVKLIDKIPANTTFDSLAGQAACSFDTPTQTVTCTIGSMPSGQTLLFTVNVKPTGAAAGTTITNTAQVSANEADPNPANNTATLKTLVLATGTVVAWGANSTGQLGDGTTTQRLTPVPVSLGGVTAISAGRSHSIALKFDGTVWAWGSNTLGQLGDGTTTQRNMPVQVSSLTSVVAIAAGGFHSLALKKDGTVWAWGDNSSGQLGDGSFTNRLTPVQVTFPLPAIVSIVPFSPRLAAGDLHSLVIRSDGNVYAWGDNSIGQLADGTTTTRNSPVNLSSCALPCQPVGTLVEIAGGAQHSLGVDDAGLVWVWGQNSAGQLCDGTTTSRTTPFNLSALTISNVIKAAANGTHSAFLKVESTLTVSPPTDGTVFTCGFNGSGQLGNGTTSTTAVTTPVQVKGIGGTGFLTNVIAISASAVSNFTLALRGDGTIVGWGDNSFGELGDGTFNTRSAPVQVSGLTGALGVAAGGQHSLAVVTSAFAGVLAGIARCSTTSSTGVTTTTTLPFATVRLFSGSVVVETVTADANGAYLFSGLAPLATYDIRYSGTVGTATFSCGVRVTTDSSGGGTVPSPPALLNRKNHTWFKPFPLQSAVTDVLTRFRQKTWYSLAVGPQQIVTVQLSNLSKDYTLTAYRDLRQVLAELRAQSGTLQGIQALSASLHDASTDDIGTDDIGTDDIGTDDIGTDDIGTDDIGTDDIGTDDIGTDDIGTADLYSTVERRGLRGISAHRGTADEIIRIRTRNYSGLLYFRVGGHAGVFDTGNLFSVVATAVSADSSCAAAALNKRSPTNPVTATGKKTLILTSTARLGLSGTAASDFVAMLNTKLAGRPEVNGVVVDLSADPNLQLNYADWDTARPCVHQANVVGDSIHQVVDQYRATNPIEYLVIVGGDLVVPFRRVPDRAELSRESRYSPPLDGASAGEASLAQDYVLTDNFYAASRPISRLGRDLYVPEIATGRLVESVQDITAYIDAYVAANGVMANSSRAFSAGYDFLTDLANTVTDELAASGVTVDTLISNTWTADNLRQSLLQGATRYGYIGLQAHFAANRLVPADNGARLLSTEIANITDGRFKGSHVVSIGCHSGYNIQDAEAILLTQPTAFPEGFLRQGATLYGQTGYGYGDTVLLKNGEALLAKYTHELRFKQDIAFNLYPNGVPVGKALVNAKRAYLNELFVVRGIDEKVLAEATIYGLPTFAVALPLRIDRPQPTPITTTPKNTLGLSTADVTPAYTLHRNPAGATASTPSFFDAGNGDLTFTQVIPARPILPRTVVDVRARDSAGNTTLPRGAILFAATYDEFPFTPLLATPATQDSTPPPTTYVNTAFTPVLPFRLNELADQTLVFIPMQYLSNALGTSGTARTYSGITSRVYYSTRTGDAALADGPAIVNVALSATSDQKVHVDVTISALNDAGVEDVWITFTGTKAPLFGRWRSVQLTAGPSTPNGTFGFIQHFTTDIDPALGDLTITRDPLSVRLFVQAVAGFGVVSVSTNDGLYYRVVPDPTTALAPKIATRVALSAPAQASYRSVIAVTAALADANTAKPLSGRVLTFRLGGAGAFALTDVNGLASARFTVQAAPGDRTLTATYAGDVDALGAGATAVIRVTPAPTTLAPTGTASVEYSDSVIVATLVITSTGLPLGDRPITIGVGGSALATYTDGLGRVRLDTLDFGGLGPGSYAVTLGSAGDDRYASTSATLTLTVLKEKAFPPTFLGGPQPTGTVTLSAQVSQVPDGSMGDLTRAFISYKLLTEAGTTAATLTAPVAADGSSTATVTLQPGVYSLEATVDGFFGSPTTTALLAVFDPTVFVTGGGWVLTPDPATLTNPAPTVSPPVPAGLKANFGFNLKYQTGTTIPTGSFLFQLKESSLTFKASSFDWLVISGTHAEFQGAGTINGAGSFGFRALVDDLGPGPATDKFEIRIWDPAATPPASFDQPKYRVVNTLGTPGGGNIIVH